MKKFISIILCVSVMLTLSIPVFATSTTSVDTSESQIKLSDDSYLIAEDFPNGDAKFTIEKNGLIIAESYVNRAERIIRSYNSRAEIKSEVIKVPVNIQEHRAENDMSSVKASIPSGFTYNGKITYNFYGNTDHVVGTRSLNIYHDYDYYTGSRYNVNGTYQDIASFASKLVLLLSIPGVVSSKVALTVLANLGIASTASSFFIPDHYMRCNETQITWLGQVSDFTNIYATVSGNRYNITEEGYESKIYTTGDFWALSSYSNHTSSFAVKMYWTVVGRDTVEIVSWS